MKKFRFRLEKIEKLKRDREKQFQKALSDAKRSESAERDILLRLRREASMRRDAARVRCDTVLDTRNLRSNSDYIRQLDFLIGHQEMRLAEAKIRTARCRVELTEASKEARKLGRLEQIRRQQYNREMDSLLQKENDEIASNTVRARSPRLKSPAAP